MHEFSTADGFVEITECLGEMIKYLANEPSAGLFYVQQHTRNAVPNLVNIRNNVINKTDQTNLHTEDLKDSVTIVSSMKECGFPIADEMIGDINKTLMTVSTKQPRRGLINTPSSSFLGRTISWNRGAGQGERAGNYFSTFLKSARENASNFKWTQLKKESLGEGETESIQSHPNPPFSVASTRSNISTIPDVESDELPVSSKVADYAVEEVQDVNGLPGDKLLSLSKNLGDFNSAKEAKLEEWLGGASDAGH